MKHEGKTYSRYREGSVSGRYLPATPIMEFFEHRGHSPRHAILGKSVEGRPIYGLTLGEGPIRILMWSQMHGNESTTTKAVLDLINYLDSDPDGLLHKCRIMIIPMLNPDGAERYTRINANGIDLNRDARDLSQPESRILRSVFTEFVPDYCFNLHGQRTLFSVGPSPKPATVSFLSPASDAVRSVTRSRALAMQLIVAMSNTLETDIPGMIGRYDDSFNPCCVGDSFQMEDAVTILFEAGHYPNDYMRERTRELIWNAMIAALETIATDSIGQYDQEAYFAIPENGKLFFDILVHHAEKAYPKLPQNTDIGIQFKEELLNGRVEFVPFLDKRGNLSGYFGHENLDLTKDRDIRRFHEILKNQGGSEDSLQM